MGPRERLSLFVGSVWWISLRQMERHQRRRRHLHVVRRPLQLLPVRQLGVSAIVCLVEHALVFQWSAHSDFSERAFEGRDLADQWLAVVRHVQRCAGRWIADTVAAEWKAIAADEPVLVR